MAQLAVEPAAPELVWTRNTAGHRSETEHSLQDRLRSVWQQGRQYRGDLQKLFSDDKTRQAGTREANGGREAAESGWKRRVELEYFQHLTLWIED